MKGEGEGDDKGLIVDLHDSFKARDFAPWPWGSDRLKVKD